jgi:hypothetical protein
MTTSIPAMHVHTLSEPKQPNKATACDKSSTASPPQAAGMLWFAGWLFTIGFAHLVWWKAILGLVLWPYFIGTAIR